MTILGVRVDPVDLEGATQKVVGWVKRGGKQYIVTTNVEFIVKAQKDLEFKKLLNQSDLSISDSSRLDWAHQMVCEKNPLKKLLIWPFFLLPNLLKKEIPTTTGVDLMNNLCRVSAEKGSTIGFLGGREGVAEKTAECLRKKFPGLKVSFTEAGGQVSDEGQSVKTRLPSCDILFVAFGAPKQEKWIVKNMNRVDAKVFIGVGGAFDYLSGSVPRAPKLLRTLGLEWLFRLILQPWRIKRFGALLQFIFLVW